MKRTTLIILSLLLFLEPIQPTPSHKFNSIFSFGDSCTDTGNANVLAKKRSWSSYTDNLPYGMTFFRRPSNRFCDGRLIVDFLGATALDDTFFKQHNITTSKSPSRKSLSSQLQWFEELKPSLCQTPKECRDYFGRSLFILGQIQGNDYFTYHA
ncbi:GDSL esterase/lipase [Rhynchospora pubera]|uniref:GDSL esterase/lipase n=1 Tax=Rhynchospora pubera TaxID=906938 RepID=A0AAV8DCW2_9POAL|nr:GDSL esterase/lipase [Rhynchospora pubera]